MLKYLATIYRFEIVWICGRHPLNCQYIPNRNNILLNVYLVYLSNLIKIRLLTYSPLLVCRGEGDLKNPYYVRVSLCHEY